MLSTALPLPQPSHGYGVGMSYQEDPDTGVLEVVPLVRWQDVCDGDGNLLRKEFLPPSVVKQVYDRVFQDRGIRALEVERCRRDTWYFVRRWLWTFDGMDRRTPAKRFPDYDYLEELARAHDARRFARERGDAAALAHPHMLVVKPRQVLYSILIATFGLAYLLMEPMSSGWMMSLKLARVDDRGAQSTPQSLFGKIRFMYNMLAPWWREFAPLEFTKGLVVNARSGASLRAEVGQREGGVGLTADYGMIDECGVIGGLAEILAVAEPGCPFGLTVGGTPREAGGAYHKLVLDSPEKTSYRLFELDWWRVPPRRACKTCGSDRFAEDDARMVDPDSGESFQVMVEHAQEFCRPQDGCHFDVAQDRWTAPWFEGATRGWSEDLKRREYERDFYRAQTGRVFKLLRRRSHVVDLAATAEQLHWLPSETPTLGQYLERVGAAERWEFWDHGFGDNTAIWHVVYDGKRALFREYFEMNGETAKYYCRRAAWLRGEFHDVRTGASGLPTATAADCWLPAAQARYYENVWGPPLRHFGVRVRYYGDPAGPGTGSDSSGQSWHKNLRRGVMVAGRDGRERHVGRILIKGFPVVPIPVKIEAGKAAIEDGRVYWVRDPVLASSRSDAETGYNRVESYHRNVDDDGDGAPMAKQAPVHDVSSHAADAFCGCVLRLFGVRKSLAAGPM